MAYELAPEPTERPQKRRRGEGTGSRFFVLDRDAWASVYTIPTANRMNVVLTYLVLLAGTGADHRLTKWSVSAVSEYTGMRKDAARKAVSELLAGAMIERAPSWTPNKPHHTVTAANSTAEPIFLPVQLVTGLTGSDTTMLCRIRETGDPILLRLLIDLYGHVTIDAPHAVAVSAMRGYADGPEPSTKCLEVGAHAVWEMEEMSARQTTTLSTRDYIAKGEDADEFWRRFRLLARLGATYDEPWLCSSSSADAELIFPLATHAQVCDFADTAARTLLAGSTGERQWLSDDHPGRLVVLPAHHRAPAILWLTKMTVEADTPGRRAAYGERARIVSHWLEQYSRLCGEASEGAYANPLRTQPRRADVERRPHQGDQGHQGLSRASN